MKKSIFTFLLLSAFTISMATAQIATRLSLENTSFDRHTERPDHKIHTKGDKAKKINKRNHKQGKMQSKGHGKKMKNKSLAQGKFTKKEDKHFKKRNRKGSRNPQMRIRRGHTKERLRS